MKVSRYILSQLDHVAVLLEPAYLRLSGVITKMLQRIAITIGNAGAGLPLRQYVESIEGDDFGQVWSLVKELNDRFDNTQRRIYVSYGTIDYDSLFLWRLAGDDLDPNRRIQELWLTRMFRPNATNTINPNTGYAFEPCANYVYKSGFQSPPAAFNIYCPSNMSETNRNSLLTFCKANIIAGVLYNIIYQ